MNYNSSPGFSNVTYPHYEAELTARRSHGPVGSDTRTLVWQALIVLAFIVLLVIAGNATLDASAATLVMDFGDHQRIFEGEVTSRMTVLDALNASVIAGNIRFRFMIDGENYTKVFEINDHEGPLDDSSVVVTVNNQAVSSTLLHRTLLEPSDLIIVRLAQTP